MDARATRDGPSTVKGDSATATWCSFLAAAGLILGVYGVFADETWAVAAAAALIVGVVIAAIADGVSRGDTTPQESLEAINRRIERGLVGTSIVTGVGVATVVDDSVSGGARLRRTVKAVDEDGQIGVLFVELDRSGRVVAAAPPGGQWAPAHTDQ